MSGFPDYYAILKLSPVPPPTADDVRRAYRRASLLTHPDRNPNLSDIERRQATENFQKVADAYYVLSDSGRRREYDRLRARQGPGKDAYGASASYFSKFFGGGAGTPSDADPEEEGLRPNAEATFADVFEDLLRPEVQHVTPFWKYLGTASGAALGFIVGNIPGAALGAASGNRLGAIRDAKGKSVYSVFVDLDAGQKAAILRDLAMKVLGTGLS